MELYGAITQNTMTRSYEHLKTELYFRCYVIVGSICALLVSLLDLINPNPIKEKEFNQKLLVFATYYLQCRLELYYLMMSYYRRGFGLPLNLLYNFADRDYSSHIIVTYPNVLGHVAWQRLPTEYFPVLSGL
jgi:hypothetical protein